MLGRRVALAVLLLGLGVSVAMFLILRGAAEQEAQAELVARAQRMADALEAKVALPVQTLESLLALQHAAGEDPAGRPSVLEPARRESFARFAQALMRRHPGLAALELADAVTDAERQSFEGFASERLGRPFTVREPTSTSATGALVPSPRRDRYFPLVAMEPWSDEVIGLDVAFESERRAAIGKAIERGEPFCGPRIRLVEDAPGVFSVAVYMPEYRGGFVPQEPSARLEQVTGLAIAIFRLEPLAQQALAGLDTAGLEVHILDRSPDLAPGDARAQLYPADAPTSTAAEGRSTAERGFSFAGRQWAVQVKATLRPEMGAAWVALALGLVASVFLGLALGALVEARRFRTEMREIKRLGQYEVVRLIAEGGMGRVYEARHLLLRRRTALKVITRESATEELLLRFEREAHATSLLTHPNTIIVFDYGRSQDGHFYYAMEYVDGPSFDALVRYDGPLPAERVRHLMVQVCEALAEAHGQGLVHRDVKPQNLMVTRLGGRHDFVKVLDFGLVKDIHAPTSKQLTEEGSVSGTPGYLPPEVFEDSEPIGPSADVYAVGCVLHLLYTGREVFESPMPREVIARHIGERPRTPSERFGLDPVFDTILTRCLEKSPRARFPSCIELLRALEALPLAPFPDVMAQASWQRWEAVRDARAGADEPRPGLRRLGIALDRGADDRVRDARAFRRTETGLPMPAVPEERGSTPPGPG